MDTGFLIIHLLLSAVIVFAARQLYYSISIPTNSAILGLCLSICAVSGYIICGMELYINPKYTNAESHNLYMGLYPMHAFGGLLFGLLFGWIVFGVVALARYILFHINRNVDA